MLALARRRAAVQLERNVEVFGAAGYRPARSNGPLEMRLEPLSGRRAIILRMVPQGRIFGGAYGLEVETAEPLLPPTRGLRARGRGVVRTAGVAFRARPRDAAGARLARELAADLRLGEALAKVHFERVAVRPDGRPVIRHVGGSLVWLLFPPVVRAVPLVEEQARATLEALELFAREGAG